MTQFHRAKMKALILHALATCEPGQLSFANLNTILYLADVIHLKRFGHTITGETYVRDRMGPVGRHSSVVRAELVVAGLLVERRGETDIGPRIGRTRRHGSFAHPHDVEPLSATELMAFGAAMEHLYGIGDPGAVGSMEISGAIESADVGEVIDLRTMASRPQAAAP